MNNKPSLQKWAWSEWHDHIKFRVPLPIFGMAETTHFTFGTWINLGECQAKHDELECGPMPNVMVALPNIGGALCSMPQSLADVHY